MSMRAPSSPYAQPSPSRPRPQATRSGSTTSTATSASARSTSGNSASAGSSHTHHTGQQPALGASPRFSPAAPAASPSALSPALPAPSPARERPAMFIDELDKWGYMYSLRVAALHQHLLQPEAAPARHLGSNPAGFATPPLPPFASPTLNGTSPNGSKFTFGAFTPPPIPPSPAPSDASQPQRAVGRRKSFGFLGGKDKDRDECKLPKEFLIEFWGALAAEDGDVGWKQAVGGFLALVGKKGTKTNSGLNMREVPTLLETFTSCLPPPGPQCAPAHVHQSHLLQLLYDFFKKSSHFSPLVRAQSEKDRDLLFRLRAEVQSYMLAPSPDPSSSDHPASPASTGRASSPATSVSSRRLASPLGLGRATSDDQIKRKPSPMWNGSSGADTGEMVETVVAVWGLPRDMVERDLANIKRHGSLEQLYYTDLKRALSMMSALPQPLSTSQKTRQAALTRSMSELLSAFPDVATTGSADTDATPRSASEGAAPFFTPPRRSEVLSRLAGRASESMGHNARVRDLIERCRGVWLVESRREREAELASMMHAWSASLGSRDEIEWARRLAETVRELAADAGSEPLPPTLEDLVARCLGLLRESAVTIFPTGANPTAPSPSAILILRGAPKAVLSSQQSKRAISDMADELHGAAVGEYVAAVSEYMGGLGENEIGVHKGANGKDAVVEGFEKVAGWIEKEVAAVQKVWGKGLGPAFNPAAIILSKQLPLFLAELQVLDRVTGAASDVFHLYEVTARLVGMWEEMCPGLDHGFDVDTFFEPHVLAWLRETEVNDTQQWVSRAVGMDSWVPEGENKHSQSVIDLFEFIRASAKVVLHDLPLSEYKRAVYLIDLSKTVSIAVSQYASTVQALFAADLNPNKASTPISESAPAVGGKASAWLAKGKQAVKSLEKKKVDGFVIPPAACVKLTDMGAAQVSLDDLAFAMEADETARIVREHRLSVVGNDKPTRSVFSVTVLRGGGLLGKSQTKPADAFVAVTDKETGERLIKTRTVLAAEDPKWEESFEIAIGGIKPLEITCYDRQLVGKHESIGSASIKLDPRKFEGGGRDVLVPLAPRGLVTLRIAMQGGEKNDVGYHLQVASRALDRAAQDMVRDIVDRIADYAKSCLSTAVLANITKPLRDKKKPRTALSEEEVENALMPLFEYLNDNFSVFSVTLTHATRVDVMLAIWRRLIELLVSLLVPPLSDKPSAAPPLSPPEVDVVYKWLALLRTFFNAAEGGVEHGVPAAELQAGTYKDIIVLGQYLDLPTAALRDRAAAAVKAVTTAPRAASPASPATAMRGLSLNGTPAPAHGRTKVEEDNERMAEVLLRIARTRPDMGEFLPAQVAALVRARVERQGGVV
ncbi:hypothetical protein Q5752_006459 [Cryptotrichosporon argae]